MGILTILGASFLLFQGMPANFTNVSYGSKALEKMDVYLAPSAVPTPVVVEFHPGGWSGGSKSDFIKYGGAIERIYQKGISVISVNYPLAPADLYPSQNLSCQRAIQFIRSKSAQWNIDKTRIGAVGRSAGAHLAMWVAMSPDAAVAGSHDLILKESSRLRAVVSVEGPSDFTDPYYKHDPAVVPGMSPVWQYFGVATQAAWDAIPNTTKQSASPRWLAAGAAANLNKNVSILAVHGGDPLVTNSNQLAAPNPDVHALLQGMIFTEMLASIGNIDGSVWIGPSVEPLPGIFSTAETIADWFSLKLTTSTISNSGFGTPGCFGGQFLSANGAASPGNNNFTIFGYLGPSSALGAIVLDTAAFVNFNDPLGVQIRLWIDPFSPNLSIFDYVSDPGGKFFMNISVPGDPSLSGSVFFAQSISAWGGPGTPLGCAPSPLKLSTSHLLRIEVP